MGVDWRMHFGCEAFVAGLRRGASIGGCLSAAGPSSRGLRRGAPIVKKWIIMHKVISFCPKLQKDRRRVSPQGVSGA